MPNDFITLSICIPTFNRSRYLNTLLQDISENFKIFPFQYEIIISSNASTDDTDEVVHNWLNKLPIVYIKQETNIGSAASLNDAYSHARGTFSIYLADDDFLEVPPLIEALINFLGVRRQGFWHQWGLKLRESLAHLVDCIMRRVVCDASAAFRVYSV